MQGRHRSCSDAKGFTAFSAGTILPCEESARGVAEIMATLCDSHAVVRSRFLVLMWTLVVTAMVWCFPDCLCWCGQCV